MENKNTPPWYKFAKRYQGKNESDPAFNKEMSKKWSLFGMNLGTIAKSWAAWCGLFVAVGLAGASIDHAHNGALARNWGIYGVGIQWKVEGIPQGAIVHINHKGNCSSGSSNHVAYADGDCAARDLLKKGATINLYGGNQGNRAKVSTYPVWEICNVRWPKEYPKRGTITKSINCTSGSAGSESTR